MRSIRIIGAVFALLIGTAAFAQTDRREVRRGNREFRRGEYKEADISYRKALVKDSLSFAANYNLANTQYRQGNYQEATAQLQKVAAAAPMSPDAVDYYFNLGDCALAQQDWNGAIQAFQQVLLRRPDDMQAKENLAYAKLMQQDDDQGGQNDQNQDQNQDQDQKQDQDKDQDQNNPDQNKDNQDQNKDNQDQNKDNPDQNKDNPDQNQNPSGQQPSGQAQQPVKISPQQAQQMLEAIQAKEKQTQDKVKKAEAEAAQSRQKEKNW